jgi:NADPH-dependent 2,4-dienoyl-CoA reductase/sulfur reductase-like enzyme
MQRVDVLVVGAGPAGLSAALAAAEAGASVQILDDNPTSGGQIWRSGLPHQADARARQLQEKLDLAANVQMLQGARIIGILDEHVVLVETQEAAIPIRFERLILATGARERLLPFPGWTLPGVTGAGGLQALVKGGYPVAGKRVVVAGSGPLLLAAAASLRSRGAKVVLIAEQASTRSLMQFAWALRQWPGKLLQAIQLRAQLFPVPYLTNSFVLEARGKGCLQQISLHTKKGLRLVDCDFLACGYGLLPNLELARMLGCRMEEDFVRVDRFQCSSIPHIFCAGEITGIAGVDSALVQGQIAGLMATERLQEAQALFVERDRWSAFSTQLAQAFSLRPELSRLCREDTIVCRCEDVCYGELMQYHNWRSAKLQTRCGMGPCQGRVCGVAIKHLFGWSTESIRPPLSPARVESLIVNEDVSSLVE